MGRLEKVRQIRWTFSKLEDETPGSMKQSDTESEVWEQSYTESDFWHSDLRRPGFQKVRSCTENPSFGGMDFNKFKPPHARVSEIPNLLKFRFPEIRASGSLEFMESKHPEASNSQSSGLRKLRSHVSQTSGRLDFMNDGARPKEFCISGKKNPPGAQFSKSRARTMWSCHNLTIFKSCISVSTSYRTPVRSRGSISVLRDLQPESVRHFRGSVLHIDRKQAVGMSTRLATDELVGEVCWMLLDSMCESIYVAGRPGIGNLP